MMFRFIPTTATNTQFHIFKSHGVGLGGTSGSREGESPWKYSNDAVVGYDFRW